MDLIHFGTTHVHVLLPTAQLVEPTFKPRGLWVSDESTDDGWQAWCQSQAFALDRLAVRTRIHLASHHRLLRLTTAAEVVRFTDDYGAWPAGLDAFPWRFRQGYAIDWACVAKDYDGILMTPYQWSLRLNDQCFWYYGVDCASGCIWHPAAVEAFEPL